LDFIFNELLDIFEVLFPYSEKFDYSRIEARSIDVLWRAVSAVWKYKLETPEEGG
jgi:hypothetical protein